ncbi:CDP-diacylglycerol--serine O-phosphatidyltransferase [Jannaschia rubra]|uniref:CDP-diacylglycerol--serine O-phosphatidyltransferase n=1 Tax=Jannaschia rubra TaxID=282197 RepID=A0A0M6XRT4_9RHOB|nr:CDP-diacylglycerol--serine O-phosphatidyltransferase [Jannaschia rubra]CTQ33790.1 phosphatidylglycerophosphate synthetase [Jannaschia rubra]SFG09113.1 CDP-diacylglycerol---serine O-phosphatidyltransferase [Jannaschia rubra]
MLDTDNNGSGRLPLVTLVPNLVTILGLCFGLTSIRFTFADQFHFAAGLLILAALVDGLDGLLARRLNASSPFGAELDSLSDFVCFGVAPALMVYHFGLERLAGMGWLAALFFAICCCLRLARFNVAAKAETSDGKSFTGVPAPAGAMLGIFPVTLYLAGFADLRDMQILIAIWVVFVGAMMIARFSTISLKAMRVDRDNVVYVLLGAALIIGLMLTRIWLFHVCATVIYLAILGWGLVRRRA